MLSQKTWVALVGLLTISVAPNWHSAFAMSKAVSSPSRGSPGCTPPVDVTARPVRKVVLKPVTTQPFSLPNGAPRIDLTSDLNLMLTSAVANTQAFSPTDPGDSGNDYCGSHIEIRAGVSTLMLDAFELGIQFGYSPTSGSGGAVTSVTGKAKVRIGQIAMDFGVWNCTAGSCSLVFPSTSTAATVGGNLSVEIDFSVIKTGPDLVLNTMLGDVLRKIMDDGMKKLSDSLSLNKLPWTARVREYLPDLGTLVFDAGSNSNLKPNQTFAIFAPASGQGACSAFRAVAHVHTTQVESISSTAIIDQVLDPRGIQDGDLVMVRPMTSGSPELPSQPGEPNNTGGSQLR
ncbi:hypothetical protein WDW37_10295 [Bdellovibrionota bacterium FG-1]